MKNIAFAGSIKRGALRKFWLKLKYYVITHQDWLVICAIITIKVVLLSTNIGQYPYIENDEATYALRAASFAENGQLDYYTYWYDHAPAGWITMSPFIFLNNVLGSPISNVLLLRFIMVGFVTGSSVLVYAIGKKLFKSRLPALLAVTLLVFSPLLLYYQRRILLDNVMIFWLLLSIYFIVNKPHKLRSYALSGIVFGIAVLSKINAVFMVPAMLYLIWQSQPHKVIRRHALVLWTFLMGSITSLWLLYAGLKGELLPYSAHPETGAFEKISLIDTLKFQGARGGEPKLPWDPTSNIYPNAVDWFARDTLFIALFAALFIATLFIVWRKKVRKEVGFVVLSVILLGLFMVRGGVVLGFYILPLAPFAALIIGWAMAKIVGHVKHADFKKTVATICILGIAGANIPAIAQQWYVDETSNQLAAVEWVKQNVPDKNTLIISDNYALPYLVKAGYTNVDYQYKVEYDPAVNEAKYNKDWRNGAYIIMSHEVIKQIKEGVTPFVKEAFDHSVLVADFRDKSSSYIDIGQYVSTNGDWAQVYKIKSDEGVILQDAWQTYKTSYLRSYGQILNPETNTTTAIDQATAMYMAVQENDLQAFNGIWQWTKDHFQNRLKDKLLSSEWGTIDGVEQLIDSNANTDASLQAVHALLEADSKWHGTKFSTDAQKIINDLSSVGFRSLAGLHVQISFATDVLPSYLINLSYNDPYVYSRIASFVTQEAQKQFWQKAYNDYFVLLATVQSANTSGLLPNWIRMSTNGALSSAADAVGALGDTYGYEAFKVPFMLARDKQKNKQSKAAEALQKLNNFFVSQFGSSALKGTLYAGYTLQGQPTVLFEDIATNTTAIAAMRVIGSKRSAEIETEKIRGQYNSQLKLWGNAVINIRNQHTAWAYLDLFYERL